MKAIIAGGRDYFFTPDDLAALDGLRITIPITEVVCGCQTGADSEGEAWAISNSIPVKRIEPDWNKYRKAAGPIRNGQMADYADVLIAFPGGAGTANMIQQAKARGLKVYKRKPSDHHP